MGPGFGAGTQVIPWQAGVLSELLQGMLKFSHLKGQLHLLCVPFARIARPYFASFSIAKKHS